MEPVKFTLIAWHTARFRRDSFSTISVVCGTVCARRTWNLLHVLRTYAVATALVPYNVP